MRRYVLILLLIGLIAACSPVNTLSDYDPESFCPSSIEGNVIETTKWMGDAPLLVTRSVGRNFDCRTGEILEITEDGVVFNEDRRSMANNPGPKEFKKSEIVSLIDEEGEVIMGEFPEGNLKTEYYQVVMRSAGSPEIEKPYVFRLYPQKSFSYCLQPGEYEIEAIGWLRKNKDSDITADPINRKLIIEEGNANYFGDIYVNMNEDMGGYDRMRVPIKIQERPNRSASWGMAFGLVGAIIDAASRDRGIIGMLDLQMVSQPDYKSVSGLPVKAATFKTSSRRESEE